MEVLEKIINANEEIVYSKKMAKELVELFSQFNEKKSEKIDNCASTLVFKIDLDSQKRKLASANFCRDRFCPECSKRKSRLMYHNLKKVLEKSYEDNNQSFIHLVLALRNCEKENLKKSLDDLLQGFHRLFRRKKFKTSINGWYRNLEVTYNEEEDTLHPHLHIILAVDNDYFKRKSGKYLTQDYIKKEFKTACKIDYEPTAYIKKVYSKDKKDILHNLVAEASKYVTKVSDVLELKNQNLKLELLKSLTKGLHGRRMSSFGGLLKDIFKFLKLEDEENSDLLNIEDEDIELGSNCVFGVFNYDKVEEKYRLVKILENYVPAWKYAEERRRLKKQKEIEDTKNFIKAIKKNFKKRDYKKNAESIFDLII
nr:unnamed protein product [uncultured bacterium]